MESRWYLFPGQTIENTKISDRAHALHMTKTAWDGITKHLDRKKLLQEAAEKEAAIKKYLDEGSKNMTKEWENSLENVRRRKEEERQMQAEQKIAERQQRFYELRKEQEEIRTKYMDKVKKQIFMTTGHARDLTSALLTSEVLFERKKQQEFMEKIKKHEKEEDQVYLQFQKEKAEKEIKEEEEKRKKIAEKQKQHVGELKKIIAEKAEFEKSLREQKVKNEALDNIESVKETEKMEKLLLEDKMRKKKELFEERKKHLKQKKELEQQKIKEEKELDEVVQIYRDTKHRIDCMKREREKEIRDAAIKRREKIASMVMAEQQNKAEEEERVLKKAIAEKDAAEIEKIKARQEFDERMKQERLKNRQEVLAREAEARMKEEELKKWELLNRYKTDEVMKEYEDRKRKEMWQVVLKFKRELCEQMEDVKLEQQREKEIEEAFIKSCQDDDDAKFFEYANEVLELAKKKGRTTYPIERVIVKYMKDINRSSYGNLGNSTKSELKLKVIKPPREKLCRCYCDQKS